MKNTAQPTRSTTLSPQPSAPYLLPSAVHRLPSAVCRLLSLTLLVAFSQCDKTPENPVLAPYAETSLDANGGTWKPYILTSSSEIAVPAPLANTSNEYLAEVENVRTAMAQATAEQQNLARAWGANGVLRWHEIARELAANYNAPPKNNADGTYPLPDPANPGAYPRFPFCNPPYASRAFALLAVAQYDALVAAWHYKFLHNRPSLSSTGYLKQQLLPANDLPSYPSEDAVVAAASREVLKFLFPNEKPYLDAQSTEHKTSRLWAGANVQSDLDAGEALGAAVAAKIIAYAKTDKMGQANGVAPGGNAAAFADLKSAATARGITTQWTSLEIPARPPMLPWFGKVKTWNLDSVGSVRPPKPPQPGSPEFERALDEVRDIAKNRSRDQFRIAAYWADGAGSFTPPGHWNRKAAELIYEKQMNEIRAARAMALMGTAVQDAGISCWDTKYYYLLPRPTEADPAVTTSTGIPNFPAYTSGHSTFSAAAAEVLSYLFPDKASELSAMAKEASESRIYGCIHYRFDCEVGLEVGKKVGTYAVTRGKNDGAQ